jgi:hypothetical protein
MTTSVTGLLSKKASFNIIEIKSPLYTIVKIRHNNVSITISDTFLLNKHIYYLFCVLCLVNTLYDICLVNWQQCLLRAHRSRQGILVGLTSIQSVHHHTNDNISDWAPIKKGVIQWQHQWLGTYQKMRHSMTTSVTGHLSKRLHSMTTLVTGHLSKKASFNDNISDLLLLNDAFFW